MEKLSRSQLDRIGDWVRANARPIEVAKWDFMYGRASEEGVVRELLLYQNPDGGFGNGFESDILLPDSSAIASTEAIFTLMDLDLDAGADWFQRLLRYFADTRQDTPSFWEPIPKRVSEYPKAPWWNYAPDESFTPNPCAVVAAAMLLYGSEDLQSLGREVALKCVSALISDTAMQDHDLYCMQRLVIALDRFGSDLLDGSVWEAMERRVMASVNRNPSEWMNYVAQPLDLASSPASPYYPAVAETVPANIDYWISSIGDDGVWMPNFSWGSDSPESTTATRHWKGYMAVKRVKILRAFGAVGE